MSSGRTAIETVGQLKRLRLPAVFVAIHAVFAQDAWEQLLAAGAPRAVSTNSIPHGSNAISIAGLLVKAGTELLDDIDLKHAP